MLDNVVVGKMCVVMLLVGLCDVILVGGKMSVWL